MPFQFRRGTEAQRASAGITPASGELIHCTDSKAWYSGDGVTAGGNAMPAAIGQQAVTAPAADGALMFDGETQRWGADALALADMGDMEPAGAADQQALAWDPAQSAYAPTNPATLTPAGTRPIIVAPSTTEDPPAGLQLYISGDGATGTVATLDNEAGGAIGLAITASSGTLERVVGPSGFGQALSTESLTAGKIATTGGAPIGTGDFTIKMRANASAGVSANEGWMFTFDNYQGLYFASDTTVRWWDGDLSAVTDPATTPLDEWFEVCACRQSGVLYILVNGIVATSTPYTGSLGLPLHLATDIDGTGTYLGRFLWDEVQLWDSALHTSGYTPATGPLLAEPAPLPTVARPGTLWTRGPVSDGLYFCTAAGPPAAWERIAYASELPP